MRKVTKTWKHLASHAGSGNGTTGSPEQLNASPSKLNAACLGHMCALPEGHHGARHLSPGNSENAGNLPAVAIPQGDRALSPLKLHCKASFQILRPDRCLCRGVEPTDH